MVLNRYISLSFCYAETIRNHDVHNLTRGVQDHTKKDHLGLRILLRSIPPLPLPLRLGCVVEEDQLASVEVMVLASAHTREICPLDTGVRLSQSPVMPVNVHKILRSE